MPSCPEIREQILTKGRSSPTFPQQPDFANISPIPRPSNQGGPPQGLIDTLLPVFAPQPPEPRDPPTGEPPGEAKAPIKTKIEGEIAGPSGSNIAGNAGQGAQAE